MSVLVIVALIASLLAAMALVMVRAARRTRQLTPPESTVVRRGTGEPKPGTGPASPHPAYQRDHRERLASTQAETPRARSRASISDV